MKKVLIPLLATIVFIVVLGIWSKNSKILAVNPVPLPLQTKEMKIADKKLTVEIADSPDERAKGLGERKSLKENYGMLFVFGKMDNLVSFWMKDMEMSIDIIWINDGKVVKIDENAQPQPDTSDDKLKLYLPPSPVDYVVEVSSGFARANGIKVGDSVTLPSL